MPCTTHALGSLTDDLAHFLLARQPCRGRGWAARVTTDGAWHDQEEQTALESTMGRGRDWVARRCWAAGLLRRSVGGGGVLGLLDLGSQSSSCHCKYTRIIENRQRGTSLPDDMEQAHIKITGQTDNEYLSISFIYHWYSFLF
jgi:hypothetical protein